MEPIEIYGKTFTYKERRGADWEIGPLDIWCYDYEDTLGIPSAYYVMKSPRMGWAVGWRMPQREADTAGYDWYYNLGELVERESGAARGVLCPLVDTGTTPTLEQFVDLRKRLGWSARDVSVSLRLHETYVSRIERGEREWRPVYYYALLGLSVTRRAE